ncbi:MAG TPA: hypothetical protein VEB61_02565 [Candidatus Binatia bacterium]|nr:hypothetical protein [Candidatus Binatia bacterium]
MGALVVMHYPTKLFANLADHTYVRCGTGGKAWSCWGGKAGGTELRRGSGSTNRANVIAGSDERGGITCYLINGVCHQAANRILLPAGITVRGARGYDVSEALFGTYGRPRGPLGTCRAPFNQHPGVSGDLPACAEAPTPARFKAARKKLSARALAERGMEQKYIRGVLAIYGKATPLVRASARGLIGHDLEGFHLKLFMHKAQYNLGGKLDRSLSRKLEDIRLSAERSRMKIEEWFSNGEMKSSEFVQAFNKETILFQEAAAGALKPDRYRALFGLKPGENVILADPRIIKRVFRIR